jgi:hypothetical protein
MGSSSSPVTKKTFVNDCDSSEATDVSMQSSDVAASGVAATAMPDVDAADSAAKGVLDRHVEKLLGQDWCRELFRIEKVDMSAVARRTREFVAALPANSDLLLLASSFSDAEARARQDRTKQRRMGVLRYASLRSYACPDQSRARRRAAAVGGECSTSHRRVPPAPGGGKRSSGPME